MDPDHPGYSDEGFRNPAWDADALRGTPSDESSAERPTVEGAILEEIHARETFGTQLGREWARIPTLRGARDFRAFCELIAQTKVWDDVDFITLSAAWKAIQAAPSTVGPGDSDAVDRDPQGDSNPC